MHETLTVGSRGATTVEKALTVTDFVRYQGASGDFNPIHHDTEFAISAGFPGPFAVGMMTAGALSSWLVNWVGVENITSFEVVFREQAWPGDVLTYEGFVSAAEGGKVTVTMKVLRQTGSTHLEGTATVLTA